VRKKMTGLDLVIEDDGTFIRATVELPGASPALALRAFTDPALVLRWWGGELHAELSPGGRYEVEFGRIGRTLLGEVLDYRPPLLLSFSWRWAHEAGDRGYVVTARTSELVDGARLEVEHGPHGDTDEDREAATEHRDGWQYFLPRLSAVVGEESR
jgi:uncharacterized protein YndB with AHSA1/START domain